MDGGVARRKLGAEILLFDDGPQERLHPRVPSGRRDIEAGPKIQAIQQEGLVGNHDGEDLLLPGIDYAGQDALHFDEWLGNRNEKLDAFCVAVDQGPAKRAGEAGLRVRGGNEKLDAFCMAIAGGQAKGMGGLIPWLGNGNEKLDAFDMASMGCAAKGQGGLRLGVGAEGEKLGDAFVVASDCCREELFVGVGIVHVAEAVVGSLHSSTREERCLRGVMAKRIARGVTWSAAF